jgi:hypothetical protein
MAKQYKIKNEVLIGNVLGNTLRTWGTFGNLMATNWEKTQLKCAFSCP